MKNTITIFLIAFLSVIYAPILFAQKMDSVKIEYSTEINNDSANSLLSKYNYLIRAKIEEKNLFKFGEGGSNPRNSGWFQFFPMQFSFAYEHKISPSFSILADTRCWVPVFKEYIVTEGIRYYYNMSRRIRQGKAANNFSGNYFSLQEENNFVKSNGNGFVYAPTFDLLYGIQRRVGPYDYVDFGIGLSWRSNYWQYDYSPNTIGTYRLLPTVNFAIGLGL